MDINQAALLGSCISKDYAGDLFRLLATYSSISASEAASRLNLHIRTVQDFLETMYSLGFLDREEVYEKKRPYFRYTLKVNKITMELDLSLFLPEGNQDQRTNRKIREKRNSGVKFTTSRDNTYISSITIWTGQGRDQAERKINLSIPQGRFLFHLPFPSAGMMSIGDIIKKSGIDESHTPEILDIVDALIEMGIVETSS